jgi:hypothetical protein
MTKEEFKNKIQDLKTVGDSYAFFKNTPNDILKEFIEAGRKAIDVGFGLTMRDEYLIKEAETRLEVNNEQAAMSFEQI